MNENMEKTELITKRFRELMYIAIISLINSLVDYLPFIPATITTWVSRGIMLAMVVCMFRLSPVNKRYRMAGIIRVAMMCCALVTVLGFDSTILTLAVSILSIIAVYQEYSAHSEMVADQDAKLSRKWHSLFNWGVLAVVLVSFGSVVVVLLVAMAAMDTGTITNLIVWILGLPQLVIQIVYIVYIRKMIAIFRETGMQ